MLKLHHTKSKPDFVTSLACLDYSNKMTSTKFSIITMKRRHFEPPGKFRTFLTEKSCHLFWTTFHQISFCFMNTEEKWGVPEHTSHCSSIYLLWWFRARLWKANSCLHEKSRRYDLAWSQPENVFVAFHSLGRGVRQITPSGLRPMEFLRECSDFVTQHNLVILCPSVTGLLLQRGRHSAASSCSLLISPMSLCFMAPLSHFSGGCWSLRV